MSTRLRSRQPVRRQAAALRCEVCPHGFPVVVLVDDRGRDIAEAHIPLGKVEWLIAQLRKSALEAEAWREPLQ